METWRFLFYRSGLFLGTYVVVKISGLKGDGCILDIGHVPSLGSADTIAPAVSQGNTTVLDWLNEEIKALGEENFFHKDYEETLVDTYGLDYEDELVVEGGVVAAQ